jgi:hypothetical protein
VWCRKSCSARCPPTHPPHPNKTLASFDAPAEPGVFRVGHGLRGRGGLKERGAGRGSGRAGAAGQLDTRNPRPRRSLDPPPSPKGERVDERGAREGGEGRVGGRVSEKVS